MFRPTFIPTKCNIVPESFTAIPFYGEIGILGKGIIKLEMGKDSRYVLNCCIYVRGRVGEKG